MGSLSKKKTPNKKPLKHVLTSLSYRNTYEMVELVKGVLY